MKVGALLRHYVTVQALILGERAPIEARVSGVEMWGLFVAFFKAGRKSIKYSPISRQ